MGGHWKVPAGAALLALALPASLAARPAAAPPVEWTPPTPAEGARLEAGVGKELAFSLAATGAAAPAVSVSIRAAGLPANAAFQSVPGNPAAASVSWTPTRAQAGQALRAQSTAEPSGPELSPATRRLTLVAKPWPGREAKPLPKPASFVLSSAEQELYRYAFVIRPAVVRSAPSPTAARIGRLALLTPEGTTNLVLALEGRRTARDVWIRVRFPILPNNRTGWVERRTLSDWKELRTRVVVDRRLLTLTLYRRGRPVLRAPIGIGLAKWPTPPGEFFVRNQLYGFGNPVYGPIAFGTSARSPVLTDWPGGGFIGIHGTNQPEILPGRVSHGCIRLKNPHILRLAKLMPVGTPVTVE